MQIAASTRCYTGAPLAEACLKLVDHGFQKVELCLSENGGVMRPQDIAEDPEGCCNIFRETTRLTAVALHLEDDVDADVFRGIVAFAKLMKLAQITIPASAVGTPFNTEIDRLRELTSIASRDGVRVSMKSQTGHLTEDPHTAIELCQAVEGLGVTLDPSYYLCTPRGPVDYDIIFPHVYHVQLRDTLPDQLQVPVGLGEIDYSRIVTQLRQVDYMGVLSADLLPNDEGCDYPLELRKLRMLLESFPL